MKIKDWLEKARGQLSKIKPEREASNLAKIILEESLYDGPHLFNQLDEIEPGKLNALNLDLAAILQGKPWQYVFERADFYGMRLFVNSSCLIPRPETEELVAWINSDVAQMNAELKIIDLGTGSGCIALAIKKHFPSHSVWAVDIDTQTLSTAQKNADLLQIPIQTKLLNILEWQQNLPLDQFDVIVSNPPYIAESEKINLDKLVTLYEPDLALFTPNENPCLFYSIICEFAKKQLNQDGLIYFEIHERYSHEVLKICRQAGFKTELRKDLQGKDRMVKAYR